MSAVLSVRDLRAWYGQVPVLHGVDLEVDEAQIAVVLGANGAGKTTTLRALSRMTGVRTTGEVQLAGASTDGATSKELVRRGLAHVPQGRGTFGDLTVEENLLMGGYVRRRDRSQVQGDLAYWYDAFPRLEERRAQRAGSLSGGEQQMLAIARGMMSRPRLLLLDEPSLGLAPLIIAQLFERLRKLVADFGMSMLLVEQNAAAALRVADVVFLLETGRVVSGGGAAALLDDADLKRAYLGVE